MDKQNRLRLRGVSLLCLPLIFTKHPISKFYKDSKQAQVELQESSESQPDKHDTLSTYEDQIVDAKLASVEGTEDNADKPFRMVISPYSASLA
jgi:hypothetical protein